MHPPSGGRPPLPDPAREARLGACVQALAGDIGERHLYRPGSLDAASSWLEQSWKDMGLDVLAQSYEIDGIACRNLEVEMPASGSGGIVVVGAHYDTVPGSPGADDNASGIAVLLEASRLARSRRFGRTLRFVTFVNEEPPWFGTDRMGSRVYADRCRHRKERVEAMICLESLGCYRHEPGSQTYPGPLGLFYPDRGDFVAVVGDLRSRSLVRTVASALKDVGVPVQTLVTPLRLPGVDWSDHASFWRAGYPAVMLTDTAPFRNPHYHQPTDRPETVDKSALSLLTDGLMTAISKLAAEVAAT